MALRFIPTFVKDGPVSSLTVRVTPCKVDGTTHRLPMAGEEQIFMYVEAVNSLLKSYATDFNLARATSEVASLKTTPKETSVQFADVFPTKRVCCRNTNPKKRA